MLPIPLQYSSSHLASYPHWWFHTEVTGEHPTPSSPSGLKPTTSPVCTTYPPTEYGQFFGRTHSQVLLLGRWYPFFRFLVTLPVGFQSQSRFCLIRIAEAQWPNKQTCQPPFPFIIWWTQTNFLMNPNTISIDLSGFVCVPMLLSPLT